MALSDCSCCWETPCRREYTRNDDGGSFMSRPRDSFGAVSDDSEITQLNRELKGIENDIRHLLNLNACTGEDDTVQGTKDDNWTALKIILTKLEKITK